MSKLKRLPDFKNEDEERKFWANHDLLDYFDINKAIVNPVFSSCVFKPKTINQKRYYSIASLAYWFAKNNS
jgi:hypothetical protein